MLEAGEGWWRSYPRPYLPCISARSQVLEAGESMMENVQAARRREREDAAAQLAAAAAREAAPRPG